MSQEIYKWLLKQGEKICSKKEDQLKWLTEHYKVEVTNKKEFFKFLSEFSYVHLALTYLETLDYWKVSIKSSDLIKFVLLDQKINFLSLIFMWRIREKAVLNYNNLKLKSWLEENATFEEIIKTYQKLSDANKAKICKSYDVGIKYFSSLIKHFENIDFLKTDILKYKGSMLSLADEEIKYNSLFEYVYYCAKYLINEKNAKEYTSNVKDLLKNLKIDNCKLKKKYVECFNFVKWEN